jgi:hypothetical protein
MHCGRQGSTEEKSVSACLGNWDIVSWVNPATFKGDWVNLMQYGDSYDNATAADYLSEAMVAVNTAGLSKKLINVGVGTYSTGGEWCQASTACPNLDPAARFCSGPGANKTHMCANRSPAWHCDRAPVRENGILIPQFPDEKKRLFATTGSGQTQGQLKTETGTVFLCRALTADRMVAALSLWVASTVPCRLAR